MYIVVTLRNRRGNLRRWCESIKNSDMWDYGTGKTQGIEWEVVRD